GASFGRMTSRANHRSVTSTRIGRPAKAARLEDGPYSCGLIGSDRADMATENVNLGSGVPPEPLWSLQRRLYWSDRTWLLAHPDESMVRDYERGEFWPLEPALEGLDDVRRVRVSYAWGAGPGG